MTSEVVVRAAGVDDARSIAEVHVASWRAAYRGIISDETLAQLDVDERERRWRQILTDAEKRGLRGWMAFVNEHVVGFATTQPSTDEDLRPEVHELSALYLVPGQWHAGIGTALLQKAEDELRKANVPEATLWVLEANTSAIAFYERHSWILDKRDPSFKHFAAPALRYRKQL